MKTFKRSHPSAGPRLLPAFVAAFALLLGLLLPVTANAAVTLNKIQTSVYVGGSLRLSPSSGTATGWSSSDRSIATVNSNGLVRGVRKGTCTISCKVSGSTLKCTMNVRTKKTSRYVTNAQAKVWLNLLGAVESGSQTYGKRNYSAFAGPGANSPNEISCTAGAYQEYGENLRELLLEIQKQYPYSFKGRDTAGIADDIRTSWDYSPYTVSPGSAKAKAIQKIISCNAGKFVQDLRAIELLDHYLDGIHGLGVTNLRCAMFMAECYHLGGLAAVKRVVGRAKNKNNLASLRTSLYKDQQDSVSSYQIGDKIYVSRHELIYKWLKTYIRAGARI